MSDEAEEQDVSFVTLYARIVHELACNPKLAQEALARRLGVTMRTVQRHLTLLEQEGYVLVDRGRKPFTYEIQWERALPHFPQLRLSTFRPDVIKRVSDLERAG